jgi:flagellar biogenesis protein FliO
MKLWHMSQETWCDSGSRTGNPVVVVVVVVVVLLLLLLMVMIITEIMLRIRQKSARQRASTHIINVIKSRCLI